MKKILLISFCLMTASLSYSQMHHSSSLASPSITPQEIVFSYENPYAREVKMLISMDQYKTTYIFRKNHDEKWILNLPLTDPSFQLKPGRYFYKLIVDNIFITDPKNNNYTTDPYIGRVSFFDIKERLIDFDVSPQKIAPLTYRFYFRKNSVASKVETIMLTGNFNEWKPYELFLKKYSDKIWYLDYKFPKAGTYYYQYIIDGKWGIDPMNSKVVYTKLKEAQSIVKVE